MHRTVLCLASGYTRQLDKMGNEALGTAIASKKSSVASEIACCKIAGFNVAAIWQVASCSENRTCGNPNSLCLMLYVGTA